MASYTIKQHVPFTSHTTKPIHRRHTIVSMAASRPPIDSEIISALRAEVDARAAAMTNLQAQLEQVEALRAQELSASVARFKELDSALSLAEGTITSLQERVNDLEVENKSLKQIVISEMQAAEELLLKAEELADAAVQKLANWQQNSTATIDTATDTPPSTTTQFITEADAEALLDELDLLRAEVDAAELEATDLRKQLLDNSVAEELAKARAEVAATKAENYRLEMELERFQQRDNSSTSRESDAKTAVGRMMMMAGGNSINGSNSSAVAELEAEKAQLEAQLAEGRAFLEAALRQVQMEK